MKKLPLFLALDVETKEQALVLVRQTYSHLLGYKIGPRLFLKYGPQLISQIKSYHLGITIFLDFKFYDIPSATVEAVRSAACIGANYATVHSSVGAMTLKLLSELEQELNQDELFRVLPVTVLSSMAADFTQIEKRADEIIASGLTSLVCSPLEALRLKQKYPQLLLVTPGIRLQGDSKDDQKRVMTPQEAIQAGSSILVMGRSLITHKNPAEILQQLQKSIYA